MLLTNPLLVIFLTIFTNELNYISAFIIPLFVFLYFNWYPSKLFLGDSGSLFIGSYLLSLIYTSSSNEGSLKIILLCFPLLIDSTICLIRRLINKQNIFRPHKLHLYQRLVSNGLSHSSVSLLYISGTFLISATILLGNIQVTFFSLFFVFGLGFWLDKKKAIPFFWFLRIKKI